MLTAVTLREIERVFEILAELNVSREAVIIPLKPAHPGGVRLRPDHRLEIVLDSQAPFDETLQHVREAIEAILATPEGDAVQRDD
jgi:hypothetical protein